MIAKLRVRERSTKRLRKRKRKNQSEESGTSILSQKDRRPL